MIKDKYPFAETLQDYSKLLDVITSWTETTKPQIEKILSSIDGLIHGTSAKEFRTHQQTEQNDNSTNRCEDRIDLVEKAIKAGISEEGALKILFSVYRNRETDPPRDIMESLQPLVEKILQIYVANMHNVDEPISAYPFPGDVPTASVSENETTEEESEEPFRKEEDPE